MALYCIESKKMNIRLMVVGIYLLTPLSGQKRRRCIIHIFTKWNTDICPLGNHMYLNISWFEEIHFVLNICNGMIL